MFPPLIFVVDPAMNLMNKPYYECEKNEHHSPCLGIPKNYQGYTLCMDSLERDCHIATIINFFYNGAIAYTQIHLLFDVNDGTFLKPVIWLWENYLEYSLSC